MPRSSRYDLPAVGAGLGELARLVRQYALGQLNVAGTVVLANGSTSTVLEDSSFTVTTEIVLIPRDSASAAIAWWLAARDKGSVTIGHDDPGADRTFGYVAVG